MTNTGIISFIVCVAICLVAAAIGGWATASNVDSWYPTLIKPAFNPPSWIFGPVWTTLYIMMGVSLWMTWRATTSVHGEPRPIAPLIAFGVQLAMNIAWSFLFFALRNPGAAAVEIVMLWLAITVTIVIVAPFSRVASLLLVPYLLWVTFASVLNFTIWRLNS